MFIHAVFASLFLLFAASSVEEGKYYKLEECIELFNMHDQKVEWSRVSPTCFHRMIESIDMDSLWKDFDRDFSDLELAMLQPEVWDSLESFYEDRIGESSLLNLQSAVLHRFPQLCKKVKYFGNLREVPLPKECVELMPFGTILFEQQFWAFNELEVKYALQANQLKDVYMKFIQEDVLEVNETMSDGSGNLISEMNSHWDNFTKVNPAREFRFMAQVLGDALIEGKAVKTNLQEEPLELEGNNMVTLISLFLKLINEYLNEDHFKDSLKSVFDEILPHLRSAQFFGLAPFSVKESDKISYALFLHNLVQNLQPDNYLFLPHGYFNSSESHATSAEIRATNDGKIVLKYFNTGDGINYHAMLPNPNDPHEIKRSHKLQFTIPKNEITIKFWLHWVELHRASHSDKNSKKNVDGIYKVLLGSFPEEYMKNVYDENDIFIHGQLSGTCVWRSILTWMRTKFASPQDYYYFSFSFSAYVLKTFGSSESFKNERHLLPLMIDFIDEILKTGLKLQENDIYGSVVLEKSKNLFSSKMELSNILKEQRLSPSEDFNCARLFSHSNKILKVDFSSIFKRIQDMFAYNDRDKDFSFLLPEKPSCTLEELNRLCEILESFYRNQTMLSFIYHRIFSWSSDDFSSENLVESIIALGKLFMHIFSFAFNYDSASKKIVSRILFRQMWIRFEKIDEKSARFSDFRPSFINLQQWEVAIEAWNYKCMAAFQAWCSEKPSLEFSPNMVDFQGKKKDGSEQAIVSLLNSFYDPNLPCDCRISLPSSWESLILLKKECSACHVWDGLQKEAFYYFIYVALAIESMGDLSSPANPNSILILRNKDKRELRFVFEDSIDRSKIHRESLINANDYYLRGNNSFYLSANLSNAAICMNPRKDNRDSASRKIDSSAQSFIKSAKFRLIQKAFQDNYEQNHFQFLSFFSARPNVFQKVESLNMHFGYIFNKKSMEIFDGFPNLFIAWKGFLQKLLNYHSVKFQNHRDEKYFYGLQNAILLAIHCSRLFTEQKKYKNEIISMTEPYIDSYSNIFKLYPNYVNLLVDPCLMKATVDSMNDDHRSFAIHYFSAKFYYDHLKGSNRENFFHYQTDDFLSMSTSKFSALYTLEEMKIVAKEVSEKTGKCKGVNFDNLSGNFPKFHVGNECFIDFIDRYFQTCPSISTFSLEKIESYSFFIDFAKHFSNLDNSLSRVINGTNFTFVNTRRDKFEIAINAQNKIYIHTVFHSLDRHSIFLSRKFYSYWCAIDGDCMVMKYDGQSLQMELIFKFSIHDFSITYENQSYTTKYGELDIFHNYFNPDAVFPLYIGDDLKKVLITHHADHLGNELVFNVDQGVVSLNGGLYHISLSNLLKKHSLYRLDMLNIIVFEKDSEEGKERYAFLPHIYYLKEYSSSSASWAFPKSSNSQNPLGFLQNSIRSSIVRVDSMGFLSPTLREDTWLAIYYYLIVGEFDICIYFLKLIRQNSAFHTIEKKIISSILDHSEGSPPAYAVKLYAGYHLYQNWLWFIGTDENFSEKSTVSTILNRYLSLRHGITPELHVMYNPYCPHLSILTKPESDHFLKYFGAKHYSEEKIYDFAESHKILKPPVFGLQRISSFLKSNLSEIFENKAPIDFSKISENKAPIDLLNYLLECRKLGYFDDENKKSATCKLLQVLDVKSYTLRRFIHEICFNVPKYLISDLLNNQDSFSKKQAQAKIGNIMVNFKPAKVFTENKPRDLKNLGNVENEYLGRFSPELVSLLKECAQAINNVELDVDDKCESNDYVDRNICFGLNDSKLKEALLKIVSDQMGAFKALDIGGIIKSMEEDILERRKELKTSFYQFTLNTKLFIDFSDQTIRFSSFIVKMLINPKIIPIFFPDNQNTFDVLFGFVLASVQKQRLERILKALENPNPNVEILMEDLLERPLIDGLDATVEILLFEYHKKIRLRKANLTALYNIVKKYAIVQRVMGGGKTLVLGTLALILLGKLAGKFPIFMPPQSLLETNAGNTLMTNEISFSQTGHVLEITRCYQSQKGDFDHCLHVFSNIKAIFEGCASRNDYVIMSRESLLSLYNSYKEAIVKKNTALLSALQDIMDLLKSSALGIIDEIDSVFDSTFKLIYPISEDKEIENHLSEAILAAFSVMLNVESVKNVYDVCSTSKLDSSLKIPFTSALLKELEADEKYKECMKIPFLAAQMRRFIKQTLVSCLESRQNVDFGLLPSIQNSSSLLKAEQYAKPFIGANMPSFESQFSDVVTSLTYTIVSYLRKDLSSPQKMILFERIIERAESEFPSYSVEFLKDQSFVGLDETPSGQYISKYCGIKNPILKYQSCSSEDEKMKFLNEHCFNFTKSKSYVLSYIQVSVLPTITKTEEQTSSNSQDIQYLLSDLTGYSGTLDNIQLYPKAQDEILTDDRTLGTIMEVLTRTGKIMKISKFDSITKILESASYLRDDINEEGKAVELSETDATYLQNTTGATPKNRFTFYDQIHSRGVDILQDNNSTAVVTFDGKTKLSDLLQGVLRMRKIFQEQRIIFAVVEEDLALVSSSGGSLSVRDLFKYSYKTMNDLNEVQNQELILLKMESMFIAHIIAEKNFDWLNFLILYSEEELFMMTLDSKKKIDHFTQKREIYLEKYEVLKEKMKFIASKLNSSKLSVNRPAGTHTIQKQQEINQETQTEAMNVDQNKNQFVRSNILSLGPAPSASKLLQWKDFEFKNRADIFPTNLGNYAVFYTSNAFSDRECMIEIHDSLKNVLISSNLLKSMEEPQNQANLSFKLDFVNIKRRKSQFPFFIAIVPQENEKLIVFLDAFDFQFIKRISLKDIEIVSSSGDYVISSSPKENLMKSPSDVRLKILRACYNLGLLEVFSSFETADVLKNMELENKTSWRIRQLIYSDPELQTTLLMEVYLGNQTKMGELALENWLKFLSPNLFSELKVLETKVENQAEQNFELMEDHEDEFLEKKQIVELNFDDLPDYWRDYC